MFVRKLRIRGGHLAGIMKAPLNIEAIHSLFDQVWNLYLVKDEKSAVYLEHLLKVVLRVNADNTRHI